MIARCFPVLWCLLLLTGCSESGPKKYPVRGQVKINGQPAALVRVQFLHADQSLPGNLKMPIGMTDDSGHFELSTNGDKDGAVPGEYSVSFEWLSGNDLGAYDKLGGKFADRKSGKFKVVIEPKANQLAPYELTIPEAEIVKKAARPE